MEGVIPSNGRGDSFKWMVVIPSNGWWSFLQMDGGHSFKWMVVIPSESA
jgi:hypothetical protein